MLTNTTISTAMTTPNRPMLPTTILAQYIPEVQRCRRHVHELSGTSLLQFRCEAGVTVRDEGGDQAGQSSHKVGGGEGEASAQALDGEEN